MYTEAESASAWSCRPMRRWIASIRLRNCSHDEGSGADANSVRNASQRNRGPPQAELHRVALERVAEARHCRVIHQFPSATSRTRRPCHETPSSGASSRITGTSSDLGRLTPKLLNSPQN